MLKEPGCNAADRLLAVTTLSFDIAGLEMFLPLITGARVVIASREATSDGKLLAELILSEGITVLQATPATWNLLLEAGWKPQPGFKMLCGGEALPRSLANQLALPQTELWNMYGPTETTIWSAVSEIEAGEGPVYVGLPIANTQFYVVDRLGNLALPGVPGELYIGGDGVAAGYFLRPELTKDRFIDDPFRPGSNSKVYKTGDLVRQLPDGQLDFLGRLDHQVKLRGFRIELGEIEALIAAYPGVRETVVVVSEVKSSEQRLVAYIAIRDEQMLSASQWRELLSRQLPGYMIPSHFIRMDQLPKTPNGKIDRKALVVPELSSLELRSEHKPPSNEREAKLAAICAEVLSRESIGVSDNLFELGADSLHIFQISARASRAGIALSAQQVMRQPTVEALCAINLTPEKVEAKQPTNTIRRVARDNFRTKA
jgi:acyl-CoA synthetase (AMP-forming)/AMP-acid ligase II/aryl carrier-like protein